MDTHATLKPPIQQLFISLSFFKELDFDMVDFYKMLKESREQKMRTGSVAYADQKIAEQAERAAQQAERAAKKAAGGDQPLILYFYDGLEILIRPMGDLNSAILAMKHHKYIEGGASIDAICAAEIGKPCALCQRAKEDKALAARESWFIPVYMYQATKTKDKDSYALPSPEIVTYTENDVRKQAKGVRVLEMKDFGAEAIILKTFRKFMADPANGRMMDRDFLIIQDGKGKGNKAYIVDKKDPKPRPDIAKITPPQQRVWERILEKLPPIVAGAASSSPLVGDLGDALDALPYSDLGDHPVADTSEAVDEPDF
ncbi:hypothetical protein ccbrp13_56230 [Ktedonobacteria bacterium brp13]|nr:hypothetical protein ccbrp13_56230 [Ktedonobacteria bacterium brp13]